MLTFGVGQIGFGDQRIRHLSGKAAFQGALVGRRERRLFETVGFTERVGLDREPFERSGRVRPAAAHGVGLAQGVFKALLVLHLQEGDHFRRRGI